MTGARYRHVRQPSIDQHVGRVVGVDVNQDAIGGLALAAVARHRVAVVEVRVLAQSKPDGPTRVETDLELPLLVDSFERAELSIGQMTTPIRCRELHAIAEPRTNDPPRDTTSPLTAGGDRRSRLRRSSDER